MGRLSRRRLLLRRAGFAVLAGILIPTAGCSTVPENLVVAYVDNSQLSGQSDAAEQLAVLLEGELELPVTARSVKDITDVVTGLEAGEIHVVGGLGSLDMMRARDDAEANLILQETQFGLRLVAYQWMTNDAGMLCGSEPVEDSRGLLYCNDLLGADMANGPYGEGFLKLLDGQTLAIAENDELAEKSSFLQLIELGIDPAENLEVVFLEDDEAVVAALSSGQADIGVSGIDSRVDFLASASEFGETVTVFAWSDPVPFGGVVSSAELPTELSERIQTAFLELSGSKPGPFLLESVFGGGSYIDPVEKDFVHVSDVVEEFG